jgi:hypothetical protein
MDIPDTLVFNQEHVPDNSLEYEWSVVIDSDNNETTGDSEGYDVAISLTNFKFPGSQPVERTITQGTQWNTWILSGSSGSYGHSLEEPQIIYNEYSDTWSIVMYAQRSWNELANFNENFNSRFETAYYSNTGIVRDMTSVMQGNNTVTDPEGDVSYNFIDIVEGTVIYPAF